MIRINQNQVIQITTSRPNLIILITFVDMIPKRKPVCKGRTCQLPLQRRRAEKAVAGGCRHILRIDLCGATGRCIMCNAAAAPDTTPAVVCCCGTRRPFRFHNNGRGICNESRIVQAPVPALPVNVIKSERIGQQLANPMHVTVRIELAPGIQRKIVAGGGRAEEERSASPGTRRILPLCGSWKVEINACQVAPFLQEG